MCPVCNNQSRNLTVSQSGVDDCACLKGDGFCKTLQGALAEQCNDTRIEIYCEEDNPLILPVPIFISQLANLEIIGIGDSRQNVTCLEGAGLYFENVSNVTISGIAWTNCSVSHPTTVYNPSINVTFPNVSSALFFYRSDNINISSCSFSSDFGSGVTMYDVGGEVFVLESEFTDNNLHYKCEGEILCFNRSTGLYIEKTPCGAFSSCDEPIPPTLYTSDSTYVIDNCIFDSNNNSFLSGRVQLPTDILSHKENRLISHGGALGIRLTGNAQYNEFYISNCDFTGNLALWGGAVEIGIGDNAEGNSVQVSDSCFEYNQGLTGGALRFAVFPPLDYAGFGANTNNNSFFVRSCNFSENSAQAAAALSYISSRQIYRNHTTMLFVEGSRFEHNYANNSGTAVSLSGWNNEVGGYPTLAYFVDCTFERNYIQNNYQNERSHSVGFGTVTTHEIPLHFNGTCSFADNQGTALAVSATGVHMSGNVSFTDNVGVNGGAVHILAKGWIDLGNNLNLSFLRNLAVLNGGAIYSSYVIPLPSVDQRYCIFKVDENPQNVTVFFDDNKADISGNAIFLSSPGGCLAQNASSLPFSDERIFDFDEPIEKELATSPGKIVFSKPAHNDNGIYTTSITLGQAFNITPNMTDFFEKETVGVAALSLKLDNHSASEYQDTTPSDYSISGQTLLQISNNEMPAPFKIIGKNNSNESARTVLTFFTSSFPTVVGYLHLNIMPCEFGHEYNNNSHQCECFKDQNVYCDPLSNLTCVKYGYWLGNSTGTSKDKYMTTTCGFELCQYTDGMCPGNRSCNVSLGNFCEVNRSELLCANDRGDRLCSMCRDGFDFTYSALKCVSAAHCSNWRSIVISIALNIVFWILVVAVIAFSLRLDMRLGSGYLYCLIYYFGVILHLTTNNFPTTFLEVLVYLCTGIFQINPRIFGLIKTCSFRDLNAIQHHFLFYLHPIFLGLLTFSVIVVGRCFPRFVPSISRENYGLRSLCIFLYLSFNALSETSLNILDFLKFPGDSRAYVSLAPKYLYMDKTYHLPYALTALCVELFIIVPLLFILLFSPFLARIPRMNLTRLKPLLDEYQSCYKDECRWFAGFYLICRQFIFLFSLINFDNTGGILFLQILCIIVLIVHAVFQPYRKRWLNVMDTILLADLAIYSLMNGSTVNVAFGSNNTFRSFLVHLLILIPVLFLVGLIIANCVLLCTRWRKNKVIVRLGRNLHLDETIRSEGTTVNGGQGYLGSTSLPSRYVPMEREPLLMPDSRRSGSAFYSAASPAAGPTPPSSSQRNSSSSGSKEDASSISTTPVPDDQDAAASGNAKEKNEPWYKSLQRHFSSKPAAVPELTTMAEVDESLGAVDVRKRSKYTVSEAGPGAPALND